MHRKSRKTNSLRIVALLGMIALLFTGISLAAGNRPVFPELREGDELLQTRRWDEAEDWFYKFIKDNPKHAEALRRLGLIELRRPGGDVVRSQKYLARAQAVEPTNPIGRFLQGKAFETGDKRVEAIAVYDELIEAGPGKDNPPRAAACHLARFNRALMASMDRDFALAKDLFGQVLSREPQQAYATWELALIAQEEKDYEAAIEWGEKAVRNVNLWAPSEAWPYPQGRYGYVRENSRLELARSLLAAGRPQEAKDLLESVVKMVSRRTKGRRGMSKPQPKSPLEGTADLRFENAPYFYAEALAALGETKEAKKAFKSFSKQEVGDSELKSKARTRAKKL